MTYEKSKVYSIQFVDWNNGEEWAVATHLHGKPLPLFSTRELAEAKLKELCDEERNLHNERELEFKQRHDRLKLEYDALVSLGMDPSFRDPGVWEHQELDITWYRIGEHELV